MASLRKKPNSRYWIAYFTDGDGIQRQRSTQTSDRTTAQSMAQKFEASYPRGGRHRVGLRLWTVKNESLPAAHSCKK